MTSNNFDEVPEPGHWPVDPQEDVPICKDRIWVDGCFDFSHHGELLAAESSMAWNSLTMSD